MNNDFLNKKDDNSLLMTNITLVKSVIITLITGRLVITLPSKELINVYGPIFIFLEKDQIVNIAFDKVNGCIDCGFIEIGTSVIKKFCCNYSTWAPKDCLIQKNKMKSYLLLHVNIRLLTAFNLINSVNLDEHLTKEKEDSLALTLLRNFIRDEKGGGGVRVSLKKTLREHIYSMISNDVCNAWTLRKVSDCLYLSPATIKRKLKLENSSFSEILLLARMNKATKLLMQSKLNVAQVAYACGYQSASYFSTSFKKHYHITPSEFLCFFDKQKYNYS